MRCNVVTKLILFILSMSYLPLEASAELNGKVGVLFGSYGDIEQKDQLEGFVKSTVLDPDIAPLPNPLRPTLAALYWQMEGHKYVQNYSQIHFNSGMPQASLKQANQVVAMLRAKGIEANGYFGFNFAQPSIEEALRKAENDGIETLVVMHQGAQFSKVTTGLLFRDIKKYIETRPTWNVRVIGIRSFSTDSRFIDLLAQKLEEDIERFQLAIGSHIFFPIHGVPLSLVQEGDPYFGEAMYVLQSLKERFSDYHISHGFQNHGEVPFVKWTAPNDHDAIEELSQDDCPSVLIYGRISYTVDSFNTKFEMNIEMKDEILHESDKRVYVSEMFNDQSDFSILLADIVSEALGGEGDIEEF